LKPTLLYVFILICCSFKVKGQTDTIANSYILGGTVVDGSSNIPLAGAHLTSIRSYSTTSNENGIFNLKVLINDTLKISFVGYKTLYYPIPINIEDKHLTKFKLYKDSVSLQEVEIFPWPTYEDFKKAFEELNLKDKEIKMAGVKMYQDRNVEPYEFKIYHSVINPVSFIYDKLLDKKSKLRRRINRRRKIIDKSSRENSLEN